MLVEDCIANSSSELSKLARAYRNEHAFLYQCAIELAIQNPNFLKENNWKNYFSEQEIANIKNWLQENDRANQTETA